MTKMRLLSVVIPAYNVEAYISRCLLSVLEQPHTENDIDVIVVIDGATDSTLDIVNSTIPSSAKNVRVLVQKNMGLSAARNTGILATETEYVTFLDGDDTWDHSYASVLINTLRTLEPDIVEYDATMIDIHDAVIGTLKISSAGTNCIVTPEAFERTFRCYAWARAYRTSLVKKHLYPVGRRFEDTATTPWHYWASRLTISLNRSLINYRQRPNSILTTPAAKDIDDIACTISEASLMYMRTGTEYWQRVTHRSFQQGCRRITLLPFGQWRRYVNIMRRAAGEVPAPRGLMRAFQAKATLIYLILIYVKRIISE